MSKAKENELSDLHKQLAEKLKTLLTQQYFDKDGNEIPCPAQVLNVARQFLKDNHIECDLSKMPDNYLKPSDLPFDDGDVPEEIH